MSRRRLHRRPQGSTEEEKLGKQGRPEGDDQDEKAPKRPRKAPTRPRKAPRTTTKTPKASPQGQTRNTPKTSRKRKLSSGSPPGPGTEQSPSTPVLVSSEKPRNVSPSGTPLDPWDPAYEVEPARGGLSSGCGISFSSRTLYHRSFLPLYEAASRRDLSFTKGGQRGEQAPRDTGFPMLYGDDIFLSDPLLPLENHRIPLCLNRAPQQVMGCLRLPSPPPIMSPWVVPSSSSRSAWLSGPELTALTGLLQMSEGEPRTSSSMDSMLSTDCSDGISGDPNPDDSPSCSNLSDASAQ